MDGLWINICNSIQAELRREPVPGLLEEKRKWIWRIRELLVSFGPFRSADAFVLPLQITAEIIIRRLRLFDIYYDFNVEQVHMLLRVMTMWRQEKGLSVVDNVVAEGYTAVSCEVRRYPTETSVSVRAHAEFEPCLTPRSLADNRNRPLLQLLAPEIKRS